MRWSPFTIPDIARRLAISPIARVLSARTQLLNDELRRVSAACGVRVLDLAAYPVACDPRMWSRDRLHANAPGHARIAEALADLLGLPGADVGWREPLPLPAPIAAGLVARVAEHVTWSRDYLVPWLWRRVRGKSAGDQRSAKLPALTPVLPRAK